MKKLIFIFLLFSGIIFTQQQDADFFGIDEKVAFQDTVVWVSFSDVISVDLVGKTVGWAVRGYNSQFVELVSKNITMGFPSQALPLRNLKSKMKDESADVLGLTYNGQEQ